MSVRGAVRPLDRGHAGCVATASFLAPAAVWLQHATGGWHAVFVVATIANLAVAATALFILKPLRRAQVASSSAPARMPLRAAE